ncbi:Gfo/Idh/MocA family protein [Thermostaphylospora chromogena]|uniref:Predicted dehydrogenase n=1 Tax=Thermostaphylospora chromogena TaxID=35622 RepID=A0A1H1HPP5_9ACTN|nr:Gfo/Idh/MocA family oxidoreductase [Thermostaphylospora chromogena]SDR27329.1 Predicted dehydrogenase [Thermostaphylospora chromogena]
MRLGIVGLGLIAQAVHLPNLRDLRETHEVVHVCDLSATLAARVAAEHGGPVRHSRDAREVFADPAVDAVLLLTPGDHADLARAALAAGKHVLAEKPLALTVAEARELDELAADRNLVLQVGYMKMYDPIIPRARSELAAVGTPRLVRITVLHPADAPQFAHVRLLRADDADPVAVAAAAARRRERAAAALGDVGEPFCSLYTDVLHGSVVHELSLLRALFGEPPLTFAHAQIGPGVRPGTALPEPPQLQALGMLGDCQLSLSWNWLPGHPEYVEEIAVFGTEGRLYLRMPGPYLRDARAELVVESVRGGERATTRLVSEHRTGFTHELLAFHASVTEGAPVLSTAAGAAYDTAALQRLTSLLAAAYGVQTRGETTP